MRLALALFFAAVTPAVAQKVEVPNKMDFADMTLIIRDDARKEIQKDVDALTASPRHYQIKAERARTYFPIIEKIFREENLPDDFKYLVLQESALIADAVSSSNAVGFWQFKDFTGIEMGLRIDKQIDERMNIYASTRAAARYLKKNYDYFNNWLYALQAYQMGAGGVMRAVKDTEPHAKRMEITRKTYWYVKKFLAHKIAYEGGVKGRPERPVVVYENQGKISLSRLAKETRVEEEALRELNKWVRSGDIPGDRAYAILLPVEGVAPARPVVATAAPAPGATVRPTPPPVFGKVNGVRTIRAVEGDNLRRLVARAGVDFRRFVRWNDLDKDDEVVPGQVYYLGKKRLKGSEDFHKLAPGESLWAVSQRYGLRLKRLRRYNRVDAGEKPEAGTMLYLASRRPREFEDISPVMDPVEVDENATFAWAVQPAPEPEADAGSDSAPRLPAEAETVMVPANVAESAETLQAAVAVTVEEEEAPFPADLEEAPLERIHALPVRREHVVQAGETLYGIARQYGLQVMDVVQWNRLSLEAGIKPGQVILLADPTADPASATHTGEGFYHEVKSSDTLYSIARRYSVTIQELMEWNGKKDFNVSVGEKLRILRAP